MCTERYIETNDTLGPEEGFAGLLNVGNQTFQQKDETKLLFIRRNRKRQAATLCKSTTTDMKIHLLHWANECM
jgi:hypothetical protein